MQCRFDLASNLTSNPAAMVEPLVSLGPGLWGCSDPVRIVGTRLTASMTVMDLGSEAALLLMARTVLERPRDEGRASYQIGVS